MMSMRPSQYSLAALVLLLVAACNENREIKVYRVVNSPGQSSGPAADPHAGIPGMSSAATAAGSTADPHAGIPGMSNATTAAGSTADPHAGLSAEQMATFQSGASPQVTDSPPAGWKKQPATAMRQLSYLAENAEGAVADISLVILRGAAGGTLANVNRWRGQVGLQPVDEAGLKTSSQVVSTPAGEAIAVDLEGLAAGADPKKDGRMIGVIAPRGNDGWFFKMKGNSALVSAEKARFLSWVSTVQASAQQPPAASPASPAAAAQPIPAPPASPSGALTWDLPAGWVQAPPGSSMRYATFSITASDGAKGELSVTHFPGDVGGDLENVNRWRQQVSLAPVAAEGLPALITQVAAGPKTVKFIDVTGPQTRLAAGWTRHGSDTWFFKFTGPDALVSAEKANFTKFLASLRFQSPE